MAIASDRYDSTVNYLYSLQKHGIKLGLSNTEELMNILNKPHEAFRSVHIAGTNGKGSTATMISSILTESGFKVGLFTSPHLVSFTERIRINGQPISESDVIDIAHNVRKSISGTDLNPTFFEFVTAMAFYYFAINKVDWAVIETGMGGRLDATNVLNPDITVITNVSTDHSEFLGDTISDITNEKAGIIKNNIPLITASRSAGITEQLKKTARSRNAETHTYGSDFKGTIQSMNTRNITLNYDGYKKYKALTAPLTGEYQLYNICTAIRTCEVLRQKGVSITDSAVKTGLQKVSLEGRLEQVSDHPPIILDSAHNPEAALSLAVSIKKLFSDRKIILIAGVMDDKDISGILGPIAHIAKFIILTRAKYERAASPEKLKTIISAIQGAGTELDPASIHSTGTIRDALDLAKSLCRENHIILVTGSFYTTGEVKEVLGSDSVLSDLREHR
jgi:dihydrofolate synthase/folylpolyglutamate synthase